jgi:hypothetical protein
MMDSSEWKEAAPYYDHYNVTICEEGETGVGCVLNEHVVISYLSCISTVLVSWLVLG